MSAGPQKMLWLEVEPVGFIKVEAAPDGCVQSLMGAEMVDCSAAQGGKSRKLVSSINASLKDLRLKNMLSAVESQDGQPQIRCQIDITGSFTEVGRSKLTLA